MNRIYYDDLAPGEVHLGRACPCDGQEMLAYSRLNDPWPFHIDEDAARESAFGGLIASGGFIVTLWYRSLVEIYNTPRATWAFLGGFDWKLKFVAPLRAGDTVRARLTVKEKRLTSKPGRGLVVLFNEVLNQHGQVICTIEAVVLVATRPDAP